MSEKQSYRFLGSLIAVSLGLGISHASFAGDFAYAMGGKRVFKELNLTPEQKEKLQALKKEGKASRKDKSKAFKAESEAFRKKMAGNATEEELRSEFEKLQAKRSLRAKERFEHMLKVRAILTSEQRQKASEIMEKKMKERKGKWKRAQDKDGQQDEDGEE